SFGSDSKSVNMAAPADGVVTSVNVKVLDDPEILLKSPYSGGWLFTMETGDLRKANKSLLSKEKAQAWLAQESHRLRNRLEDRNLGRLAADGGHAVDDILSGVDGVLRATVIKEFLELT
ncbi:MAG: hypothetical protein FJ088_12505, partial [Deltaproteobacteria bacterium]|nr:hypothetical protein [Deltaproteobacteria bacterium]